MANVQYKKLLQQTAISAFLSFLTFAFGFIRVSYFSKHLSMEDFGTLSLLLSYSGFLIYLFTLGSFQYLFKRVNDGAEEKKSALWSSFMLTAGISVISTCIAFVFAGPICSALNLSNYEDDFKLTIIGTAITSIMIVFLFYHYGLGRNNFQNFLQFLRGSLWVIVAIAASFLFQLSLTQIFIVFNISILFILLTAVPWKELPQLLQRPLNISMQPLIKYCIPLLPYFAGVWGIPTIIRSQLNISEGPKSVALFSVAYTLMEIVFMFISTITATLSPHFFAEEEDKDKPALLYNVMLKYSILLIVLIIPFVYITRFDVILLLTSNKYLEAGKYIPLLIIFPLLRVLIIVFEQVYLKESKTIFLGTVYSIGMALSFVLSLILVPKFSVLGAIYASLASYLFLFICLYIKQHHKIDFNYQRPLAILTLASILWASVFLLDIFNFHSFIKAIPLAGVAVLSVFLLPVFNEQEKHKLLVMLKIRNEG